MAKTKQKKLTDAQREELKSQFARWIHHKTSQWENERRIEKILGRELDSFEPLEDACVSMNTEELCEAIDMVTQHGDEMIEDLLEVND